MTALRATAHLQCYERVKSADAQALKEKYEEELKREIKKLQRLRDQIKVRRGADSFAWRRTRRWRRARRLMTHPH